MQIWYKEKIEHGIPDWEKTHRSRILYVPPVAKRYLMCLRKLKSAKRVAPRSWDMKWTVGLPFFLSDFG